MKSLPLNLMQKLQARAEANALRRLPNRSEGIDFSSNDYLGFARSENLFEKSVALIQEEGQVGSGATGSRLLSGNHQGYQDLEKVLCAFHLADASCVFNSGYDANVGLLSSVPQRGDVVLYDAYSHASIREGLQLSNAQSFKFAHNDITDLAEKLERHRSVENLYIVLESVYSMDGDMPDLKSLAAIATRFNARIILDEAHATGVVGARGEGLAQHLGLSDSIFARIHTFGKALGCQGAVVLGSKELKSYLVNFAKSLIYTTALSPFSVASARIAYRELGQTNLVQKLQALITYFQKEKSRLQLESHFIHSESAIQSCVLPGNDKVKEAAHILYIAGFDVKPILSPTVPLGEERLRICLHSFNMETDISKILEIIADFMITTPV